MKKLKKLLYLCTIFFLLFYCSSDKERIEIIEFPKKKEEFQKDKLREKSDKINTFFLKNKPQVNDILETSIKKSQVSKEPKKDKNSDTYIIKPKDVILTEIEIDGKHGVQIEKYLYLEKYTKIQIPETLDGKKVLSIAYQLPNMPPFFAYNTTNNKEDEEDKIELTLIILPKTLKNIGSFAFLNQSSSSIRIPDSVTSIGYSAFTGGKLSSVYLPKNIQLIEESCFSYNQLTSITIPPKVTQISKFAFSNNKLKAIVIPRSVNQIEHHAFYKNPITRVTCLERTIRECKDLLNNAGLNTDVIYN